MHFFVAALPLALSVVATVAAAQSPYRSAKKLDARGAHLEFEPARDLYERDLTMGPILGFVAAGLYGREAQEELETHLVSRGLTLDDAELVARDFDQRSLSALAGKSGIAAGKVAAKVLPKLGKAAGWVTGKVLTKLPPSVSRVFLHHLHARADNLEERDLMLGPILGSVAAGLYGREARDELEAHLVARGLTLDDAMLAAREFQERGIASGLKKIGPKMGEVMGKLIMKLPTPLSTAILKLGGKSKVVSSDVSQHWKTLESRLVARGLTLDDVEAAADAKERGWYQELLEARSGDLYAFDMFGRDVEDLNTDLLGLF